MRNMQESGCHHFVSTNALFIESRLHQQKRDDRDDRNKRGQGDQVYGSVTLNIAGPDAAGAARAQHRALQLRRDGLVRTAQANRAQIAVGQRAFRIRLDRLCKTSSLTHCNRPTHRLRCRHQAIV